ncbi:hypothetical protein DFH08DRAFT_998271 [Mycena albidolilacea]|uniref:Uncharacterized protein n=1 Tax=Mycena albidolilacea TaxID=1033008 RepID=A0AAD7A412_9AGAR|nr:hypothetical protein DFH08DRAFT_998271 [Mycena albidolilacea]
MSSSDLWIPKYRSVPRANVTRRKALRKISKCTNPINFRRTAWILLAAAFRLPAPQAAPAHLGVRPHRFTALSHGATLASLSFWSLVPFSSFSLGSTNGKVALTVSRGPNFALSVFAFWVEGFVYYSTVNSIVPQIILNLGLETNAWRISVRQTSYYIAAIHGLYSHYSTAAGLAYSARAVGGAFGSAILDAIINNKLASYDAEVSSAAIAAGLPADSVPALLQVLATGMPSEVTNAIIAAATAASRNVYACIPLCMDPNNPVRYRSGGLRCVSEGRGGVDGGACESNGGAPEEGSRR